MPIESIERGIRVAYSSLAAVVATVRDGHEHYQDAASQPQPHTPPDHADPGHAYPSHADPDHADPNDVDPNDVDPFRAVTALTAAHPWALAGFGERAWDAYQPDPHAPPPEGLRAGVLRLAGRPGPPLPAVARFVRHGHLLITETGFVSGARSLLQALALRLATAAAPGTMRFALADPVGQGQHLSAFLRLPASMRVSGHKVGVAASPEEIEDLLATLTGYVVEVTQTRLTNVYDSVEAYNAAATGPLIPYHVLVMAGFPAGFSDRATDLLGQLARNGPRAGLYLLGTVDPGRPRSRALDLAALTALGTTVGLDEHGDLSWDDPEFGPSVIEPDQMPAADRANPWLDAVGAVASAAVRDLPFARIAIPPGRRWTAVSHDGLDVQIGVDSRGEPQHFVMGVRGVHHGLVGGDVRMGKTNLLHVLISQLALAYPPEELELYLLDFKEVEFDAYLTERLPHARAITSRTDREFGLSMLRRFHDEINRRARLCREAKVTDLPDYRRETGLRLPRALVVMDEFQVLFSAEDRIAREAGRLLADIAKRGAAFGLHLLLATQSPGGPLAAYLRPVYEQMALRIALGCTQPSVSQAILGEGNDAATRLVRAGDAIYNDRRGEGANPVMRIAMLPTRERLALIAEIRSLAPGRDYPPPASFDPDTPADFATAVLVAPAPAPSPAGLTVQAWLGEAIEIKPPTTATFERYVRSNLLVVGPEEYGHGLLLATVLSVAVQRRSVDARFTIAEFARPSSPFHGFFGVLTTLPHQVRIADRKTAAAALDELMAELDARLADPEGPDAPTGPPEPAGPDSPADPKRSPPEWFFLIAGMHRWHELAAEGDYGRPSELSARLIRLAETGPDVGLHVVAWADGYTSAERALRRAGLAHFGLRAAARVLSPAESDALLGVAAAAGLDDDRALYRDTEWPAEQVEKFKPYSIASLRAFAQAAFGSPA
jgi:DNA segregation ATPase FtsK/SpoIIIE, S-DNA-T family